MKFALGTLFGILLTIGSAYGFYKYQTSPTGQLNRCMKLYTEQDYTDEVKNNPDVIEKMKQEGFATYEDMVKDRCNHWIKNGQNF